MEKIQAFLSPYGGLFRGLEWMGDHHMMSEYSENRTEGDLIVSMKATKQWLC